ncbi:MAG: response regulator [Planctomycetes bacterium]|nr:response regulator [Planctomycetota bacterium]
MSEAKKLNILIVDDEPDMCQLLSHYLKKHNIACNSVYSGEEALDLIKNNHNLHKYDLVLMDQVMPGMDGLSTFKEAQKIDGRLPFIMISSYGTIPLTVRFMIEGGIDFIEKPIDLNSNELIDIIHSAVKYKFQKREQYCQKQLERKNSDNTLVFADKKKPSPPAADPFDIQPWKILIVGENNTNHASINLLLNSYVFSGRGLQFLSAYSLSEAEEILRNNSDIAIIFISNQRDQNDNWLHLIHETKSNNSNHFARILILTEHSNDLPNTKVFMDFNIDGIIPTEHGLPLQTLIISLTTSLRTYSELILLESERQKLERKISEMEKNLYGLL